MATSPTPSPFHLMQSNAQNAIDGTYAEDLVFIARTKGINTASAADATRASFGAKGIFRSISHDLKTGELSAPRSSTVPVVSIVQALLSWEPRQGDVIYRPASNTAYEVTNIELQGMMRVRFELVALEDDTI